MAITPPYNDIEMKTAWAEDAATTIPSVPVPGVAYRNTNIGEETIAQGQQYDSIGRSADWNQLLFKISANIVTMQKGGASLLWVSGRTYEQGALVKDPNNAQIYYRLKAGAGTTRPSSDSTNWQLLQDLFCGEGLLVNTNSEGVKEITWGLPNTDSTNPNTLIQSGVYWLNNQKTNTPSDIENSKGSFTGFIVALRRGLTTQQIAYEVNSFSMNTRKTSNSGSTWTNWTRFGVEFTLDWRSGGDYRAGDLVRDTSNSLLYVCTTAVTNSTQRPGLDTGHFTLLQSYLIGDGLRVVNNKIEWGISSPVVATDFNEMTTNGIYAVASNTDNAPSTQPGYLLVIINNDTDTAIVAQIFLANNGEMWKRVQQTDNSWSTWVRYSVFDSLDFVSGQTYNQGQLVRGRNNVHYVKKTAASVCNTEPNSDSTNFETLADNLIGNGLRTINNLISWGYSIHTVSDFDEERTAGTYSYSSNTTNAPTTANGILMVLDGGTGAASHQRLQLALIYSGEVYIRRATSSTAAWSDWVKIGPTEQVSASDLAGNGLTAASNKLNWGTANVATNVNNISTPGTYWCNEKTTNAPVQDGLLIVTTAGDSGSNCQIFIDPVNGTVYSRTKPASGSWSNWIATLNGSMIGGAVVTSRGSAGANTTYTTKNDTLLTLEAYSNWRANTNGQLYVDNQEVLANHTGQYGSGGQSSGVNTTFYIKKGSTYRFNQGSLERAFVYNLK